MKENTQQINYQNQIATQNLLMNNLQEDYKKLWSHQQFCGDSFSQTYVQQEMKQDQSVMLELKSLVDQIWKKDMKENKEEQKSSTMLEITKKALNQKLIYKKMMRKFKQILQQTVLTIQSKLSSICKDFTYYTDIQENCDVKQAQNMCKFIEHSIYKLAEQSEHFTNFQSAISSLKARNTILNKDYDRLMKHLQQRKVYSQKLKQKMSQFKENGQKLQQKVNQFKKNLQQSQQKNFQLEKTIYNLNQKLNKSQQTCFWQQNKIKQLSNKIIENQKIIDEWTIIQDNSDLKYKNRNDLIMMIRSLTLKIQKHEKQCQHSKNVILGEPVQKFINFPIVKKKSLNIEV